MRPDAGLPGGNRGLRIGVVALLVADDRLVRLVGIAQAQRRGGRQVRCIVQHHRRRVAFQQIEPAARFQSARRHRHPAVHVRNPADSPPGSEDDVEAVQARRRIQHVRQDELTVDAGLTREGSRRFDGRRRIVEAGHLCAQPRQGQGVEAEMALQVEQAFAGDVAEPFPGDPIDHRLAPAECVGAVEGGGQVDRHRLIPIGEILFGHPGHGRADRPSPHRGQRGRIDPVRGFL